MSVFFFSDLSIDAAVLLHSTIKASYSLICPKYIQDTKVGSAPFLVPLENKSDVKNMYSAAVQ